MPPRWNKVFADLASNSSRTALVVISIAVGVIAVGMIEGARQLLADNLAASYAAAQPATITFHVSPFDDSLVNVARRIEGVRAASGQTQLNVRVRARDGAWRDMQLFARNDFSNAQVNRLLPVNGQIPPPKRTLALERSSFGSLRAQIGDIVLLELPNGSQKELPLTSVVHDLTQPSTFLSGAVYGYVSLGTVGWLDVSNHFNQLLILTEEPTERGEIANVAARVRDELKQRGYIVTATTIPPVPGRLFFADSVQSMMLLLGALGIASLFSSAILVVTTLSALLAQQVREIGVMKAIGAPTFALLQMYLATVLLYSLLAIALAAPLGALGAFLLVTFSIGVLNLLPVSFQIVPGAIGLQIVAGLFIPLLAALAPVLAGSRITVREAITAYGLGGGTFGVSRLDQLVEFFRALPRPLLLSLRNAFRRKARLMLTLTTLVVGGAVFIAVLSVRASLLATFAEIYAFRQYDIQLTLAAPQRIARIEREAKTIAGVARVEPWGYSRADIRRADKPIGDALNVYGVDALSQFIQPTLFEGRWLIPQDGRALVLNADALKRDPTLKPGAKVTLTVNGEDSAWELVGIARSILRGPMAYVPYDAWARAQRENALAASVQIVTDAHDSATQTRIARELEAHFKHLDMPLTSIQTTQELRVSDNANMTNIINFLSAMAILLAFVGGLGLMGTMGINVLERTREIGVLRAIGAPTVSLMQIVIVEGILIGLISFPFAALLALPLSRYLSDLVGSELLQSRLTYTFSMEGLGIWFALALGIATLASVLPAWNAVRLTVREALVYE